MSDAMTPPSSRSPAAVAANDLAAVEVAAAAAALATPFVQSLVRLLRAQDGFGAWEGRSDAKLLAPYIVTREQRRAMPIMGDPGPEVLWRVEQYYGAVGLAIEHHTGLIASPMIQMHREGFGRVILTVGKLVVLSRHLRDVHRFGFESLAVLAAGGEKLVAGCVATIETYPEVARA